MVQNPSSNDLSAVITRHVFDNWVRLAGPNRDDDITCTFVGKIETSDAGSIAKVELRNQGVPVAEVTLCLAGSVVINEMHHTIIEGVIPA